MEPSDTVDKVVVIGAGGHGRVCAEAALAAGLQVLAFCDAAMDTGTSVNGIEVVKAESVARLADRFDFADTGLVVALGNNDTRMELIAEADDLGFALPTIIHPSAVVSPSAVIEPGTVVIANSVVNANSRIGRGCILNTACSIDHDNVLADGVQICPGVRSAGTVTIGEKTFVGTGAVITPGVTIGRGVHIMAGALVIGDIADDKQVRRFASRPDPS